MVPSSRSNSRGGGTRGKRSAADQQKIAGPAVLRRRRRPQSRINPLSILALILLIALFLARRMTMHMPPATFGGSSNAAPVKNSGEQLSPADRQSLDQVIRDRTHR